MMSDNPNTDPKLLRAFFMLEEKLEKNEDFEYLAYWLAEIGKNPNDLPWHLRITMDNYKTEILRDMLYSIKHNDDDPEVNLLDEDFLHMITGARKLGAKWPQLDTMERLVRANYPDLDESWDPWDSIPDEPEDALSMTLKALGKKLDQGKYEDVCDLLSHLGDKDNYREEDFAYDEIKRCKKWLDEHQPGIFKALLRSIKNNSEDDWFNMQVVDALRFFGVTWKDLDLLERTWHPHTNKPADIVESRDDQDERLMRFAFIQFMKCLEGDDHKDLAYWLTRLGRNDLPVPYDVSQTIKRHQPEIMRSVLKAVKYPDREEFDQDDLENMVYALRKIGADWNDLDLLDRHIKDWSDRDNLAENSKDDEPDSIVGEMLLLLDDSDLDSALDLLIDYGMTVKNRQLKAHLPELLDMITSDVVSNVNDPDEYVSRLLFLRRKLESIGISLLPYSQLTKNINIYIRGLENSVKSKPFDEFVDYIEELGAWGVDMSGALPTDKKKILSMLVQAVKKGMHQHASKFIGMLRKQGIDFPEFEAVKKMMMTSRDTSSNQK